MIPCGAFVGTLMTLTKRSVHFIFQPQSTKGQLTHVLLRRPGDSELTPGAGLPTGSQYQQEEKEETKAPVTFCSSSNVIQMIVVCAAGMHSLLIFGYSDANICDNVRRLWKLLGNNLTNSQNFVSLKTFQKIVYNFA